MGFNLENYEPVKDRITRFFSDHPDGRILTDLVSDSETLEDRAAFKASIYIGEVLKATGYAFEAKGQGVNRDAWVENAETSAIGRALANMDYCGTMRPSREEMTKVRPDTDGLDDVRNSKGQYSPPSPSGEPSERGSGVSSEMLELKKELANIIVTTFGEDRIFTKADYDDMTSEWHPGGRDLIASKNDLELLRGVVVRWQKRRDEKIEKLVMREQELAELDRLENKGE